MSARIARQWRLWTEYLLAKANGDEHTAAQKLNELMDTLQ